MHSSTPISQVFSFPTSPPQCCGHHQPRPAATPPTIELITRKSLPPSFSSFVVRRRQSSVYVHGTTAGSVGSGASFGVAGPWPPSLVKHGICSIMHRQIVPRARSHVARARLAFYRIMSWSMLNGRWMICFHTTRNVRRLRLYVNPWCD